MASPDHRAVVGQLGRLVFSGGENLNGDGGHAQPHVVGTVGFVLGG